MFMIIYIHVQKYTFFAHEHIVIGVSLQIGVISELNVSKGDWNLI